MTDERETGGIAHLIRSRNRIPEVLHVDVWSAWRTITMALARRLVRAIFANVAPTAEPVSDSPGIREFSPEGQCVTQNWHAPTHLCPEGGSVRWRLASRLLGRA